MSRVVALIPARGGSKGVPLKNIKLLGGIPLLAHSVAAAKELISTKNIFVSSDNDSILTIAKNLDITTLERPDALANDETPTDPVIADFIEQSQLNTDDIVILLQPTSPFRNGQHIKDSLQLFNEHPHCKMLMSVVNVDNAFLKAYIGGSEYLTPLVNKDTPFSRRQDLPPVYMPNGAIYIFRVGDFLSEHKIPRTQIISYLMNQEDSLDIDTDDDFVAAEKQLLIRKQYVN